MVECCFTAFLNPDAGIQQPGADPSFGAQENLVNRYCLGAPQDDKELLGPALRSLQDDRFRMVDFIRCC